MTNKRYLTAAVAVIALAGVASPAFAADTTAQNASAPAKTAWARGAGGQNGERRMGPMMGAGVIGKVSSITGTTLVVAGKQGTKDATTNKVTMTDVSYTVDASNATVKKANATSTLSAIAVGDTVAIQGKVTGTSVVATMIHDGIMVKPAGAGKMGGGMASSTPLITGNGQPVIAGAVSSVSGSSVTVSTKAGVAYTVDVSNAKIVKGKDTIAASTLVTGDEVVIQGSVNGTSVLANSIIVGKAPQTNTGANAPNATRGFFGGIGHFFSSLFGF